MPSTVTAWRSDKGRRHTNEDCALVLTSGLPAGIDALMVVADGMGGRASGAVASRTAVDAVRESFAASASTGTQDLREALKGCLKAANDAVYAKASTDPAFDGMGTTCVAAVLSGNKAFYAHLGDSRAYLVRAGQVRRLTEDHSFVAERVKSGEITEDQARRSRFRNVITRAVGLEPSANPESGSLDLEPGDVILLCSDGLSGPVPDEQIADIICSSPDADEVCANLVNAALRNGGSDNITVALAAYGAAAAPRTHAQPTSPGKRSRAARTWMVPAVLGVIAGLLLGTFGGRRVADRLMAGLGAEPRSASAPAQPSLAPLSYGTPTAMLHTPLRPDVIALDPGGLLHVVDVRGQMIRVDTSGQVMLTSPAIAALSHGPVSASTPKVACDREGNIYISDTAGGSIRKTTSEGLPIGDIAAGQLAAPSALAIGQDGSVYVIDAGRLKAIHPARTPAVHPSTRDTTSTGKED